MAKVIDITDVISAKNSPHNLAKRYALSGLLSLMNCIAPFQVDSKDARHFARYIKLLASYYLTHLHYKTLETAYAMAPSLPK